MVIEVIGQSDNRWLFFCEQCLKKNFDFKNATFPRLYRYFEMIPGSPKGNIFPQINSKWHTNCTHKKKVNNFF